MTTIALSEFARKRNTPDSLTQFLGTEEELIHLTEANWSLRYPGTGRTDLNSVVIVPINDISKFRCNLISIEKAYDFTTRVVRRRPHEDPYLETKARGPKVPIISAAVVLYSAQTLEENSGNRSSNADWEIVALLANVTPNEPMQPLTMARNYLQKPGGTYAPYSTQMFADSIYYWSQFVQARSD